MTVLCRAYTDEERARRTVHALIDAGVPGDGIRVLTGEPPRDRRAEPEGDFGGDLPPDHVVGDFAGPGHEADEGAGAFAGSAAQQREGSFGDVDRETVASYPAGVERRHLAGHRELRRMLMEAGLDRQTADRDVAALHEGQVLVLADIGDRAADQLGPALEG